MSETLFLDFETSHVLDLRKVGASRYTRDPGLIVTVVAWAFNDDPVKSTTLPPQLPQEIVDHILSGGVVSGWNAGGFEYPVIKNHFGINIQPSQISDTMQRALVAGLPAALGDCGPALHLNITKDTTAHGLMLRMARPRSLEPLTWWHTTDAQKLLDLEAYCRRDVESEREIARNIPSLTPEEAEIALMDRELNEYGLFMDIPLVHKMLSIADAATKAINARCTQITNGQVTSPASQVARLLQWLGDYAPVDLSKASVAGALKREDLPAHIREALELRQLAAKSSVKKLNAVLNASDTDNTIRQTLSYYGASRTGRWSGKGAGLQPQNLPRPVIKDPNAAIDLIHGGISAEGLDQVIDSPLNVISSCLRGVIIPRPGNKLAVMDFSQIEARVVAWLAGQQDILDVFASGEDVYRYTAKSIGLPSRQAGKCCVLGLGFGLGAKKFVEFAGTYGLTYSAQESEKIVSDWRAANSNIQNLWWRMDDTVKRAIRGYALSGRRMDLEINEHLSVTVCAAKNGLPLMTLRLPSGRRLYYRDIELLPDSLTGREGIVFSGVDQYTKKWGRVRTYGAKLVENVTQAAARDCMANGMLAIRRQKLGTLITCIHDEVVVEVPAEEAKERFMKIESAMVSLPPWARGLPAAADGHVLDRYGK